MPQPSMSDLPKKKRKSKNSTNKSPCPMRRRRTLVGISHSHTRRVWLVWPSVWAKEHVRSSCVLSQTRCQHFDIDSMGTVSVSDTRSTNHVSLMLQILSSFHRRCSGLERPISCIGLFVAAINIFPPGAPLFFKSYLRRHRDQTASEPGRRCRPTGSPR